MNNNIDYNKNGIIIAPAGYGKTEDIAVQVKMFESNKKILILTHTNVGIEELLSRIKKYSIKSNKVNIMTIASFSLKYIKMFPSISGYDKKKELFDNDIYNQMNILLKNVHIREIIKNSYDQLFVDEYQDCSISQHKMIKELCDILNYKIYGDPLQSLYEFNDIPVNFDELIENDFELIGKLDYPWRWNDKNKNELSEEALYCRSCAPKYDLKYKGKDKMALDYEPKKIICVDCGEEVYLENFMASKTCRCGQCQMQRDKIKKSERNKRYYEAHKN